MALLTTALAMLRVRWQMRSAHVHLADEQEDLRFCYDTLENVSRSFAVVISQLSDEPLRNGICIFYLVLRALDTIEDDMSVAVPVKLEELPKFHTHLDDPTWCMTGVGEGKERELLEHFPCVSRAYQQLKEDYQDIIADICKKMADGMCDFLTRPVETKADYDLYCHYVAGLVGHGLTRLFANCGFEDPHLADDLTAANHMGLFLQKTNIIRDYYEDILEQPPRVFWPKDIWGKYAANIKDFMDVSNKEAAMRCLNAMVLDAIQHMPYVISYIASLRDPSVFRFCAIPQVMAIATLTSVYNNPKTFHEKVKIAKGEACYIMVDSTDLYHALRMFSSYCERLLAKLDAADPSTQELRRELKASMSTMESYMCVKAPQRYLQTLLARYPGLGGGFIMSIVDSITNLFRGSAALPYSPSDLPPVTLSAKSV